ncbi:MAG: hypothetical protein MPN21_22320 [Thermoanaerobaculia bacterium]|nr:hypothetical protein [Thermoanaerobaculia bacterium]
MSSLIRIRTLLLAAILAVSVAAFTYGGTEGGLSVGPDVTIIDLIGISNYGDNGAASACPPGYSGMCRGYAVGTNSCNIGSVPVDWCDPPDGQFGQCRTTTDPFHPLVATESDHSVIAQNLYRLKDGRFEQIGMSFLKHGFVSTNSFDTDCAWNDNGTPNTSCVQPPAGGDQLGVGCTDFYDSSLNGNRPLGRRSDVQAGGAGHPTSAAGGELNDSYDQRLVVPESDLDPAKNAGALYWVEGHYVVRDDARAGNGLNNASYRAANIGSMPDLDIFLTGNTIREIPAIFAWQVEDPDVEIVQVDRLTSFTGEPADVPAVGQTHPDYSVLERFHAARRVTEISGSGFDYRYEYAIYNMNSDTAADGFVAEFPASADIGNAGFRAINHHSGEPYDTSAWTIAVDNPNGRVTWSAVDAGANTNALRWGTLYNFWFESDELPLDMSHSLDLFKIDEQLDVPFDTPGAITSMIIFLDGFESGNVSEWSSAVSN